MPKYDHMFDVAFTIQSDHDWDQVTPKEFLLALEKRVADIRAMYVAEPEQILECFSILDTIEEDA